MAPILGACDVEIRQAGDRTMAVSSSASGSAETHPGYVKTIAERVSSAVAARRFCATQRVSARRNGCSRIDFALL
jgi:hypothetical protein